MATFSFDTVSEYNKAEMNNVFAMVQKEISNRYDFKGTPADIDWLGDKIGFKVIGENEWQIENIIDIIRKKLAGFDWRRWLQSVHPTGKSSPTCTTHLKSPNRPIVQLDTPDKLTSMCRFKLTILCI